MTNIWKMSIEVVDFPIENGDGLHSYGLHGPAKMGDFYYNFWQDADHVKGIWRRCTLEEYKTLLCKGFSHLWYKVQDTNIYIFIYIYAYIYNIIYIYTLKFSMMNTMWFCMDTYNIFICRMHFDWKWWCVAGSPRDGTIQRNSCLTCAQCARVKSYNPYTQSHIIPYNPI